MFTFAVKLITFFALFDICFVDMNPSIRGFGAPDWAFKQLRVKPNNPGLNKNSTQLTKAVGFRETSETSPKTTGFHSYNHTWQVLSSLQSNVHLRWDQIELPRTPPRGHAPQWRLKWFQWNWDIFLTLRMMFARVENHQSFKQHSVYNTARGYSFVLTKHPFGSWPLLHLRSQHEQHSENMVSEGDGQTLINLESILTLLKFKQTAWY